MAGLLTAQALAGHFGGVTIVERDHLPATPQARSGVPQGRHLHVLLPGGHRAIERLMPRFGDDLLAAGAVDVAWPSDVLWLSPAGWLPRSTAKHRVLSASRDLIEWCARRRLLATPGVEILDGCAVCRLLPTADGEGVSGVEIAAGASSSTLRADLVVDATGRRSRLPDWLHGLGYDRPEETRIAAARSYASRVYRRRKATRDWSAAFIQADPPATGRMGVAFDIEDDRTIVTVQGAGGDHPPTDEAGFVAFARSLRSPVIHELICDAEPLTPIVGFANTANRRRLVERLRRWPQRLLVVGDSACAFNPVHGQGIAVAALTAVRLDAALARRGDRSLDGFAPAFRRQVAAAGHAAWTIATGDDLRYPTTTGGSAGVALRLQHRYLDRVMAASTRDERAMAAMTDVLFLVSPPASLFKPTVLWRALRRGATACPLPAGEKAVQVSAV